MTKTIKLTDYQSELASGSEAVFFQACIADFGFLISEHGYGLSFHEMGRECYQACFKHSIGTEYFAIRLFHEFNNFWCDIERFAGLDHQRRLRFPEVVQVFGFTCPPELLDIVLPDEQAITLRVRMLADCIRTHLGELRNIPIHPDMQKANNTND